MGGIPVFDNITESNRTTASFSGRGAVPAGNLGEGGRGSDLLGDSFGLPTGPAQSLTLFFLYGLSWPKVPFEIPKVEGGQLLLCAGAIDSETISSVTESTTLE